MRKTKTGQQISIVGGSLYFEDVVQAMMGTDLFYELLEDKTTKAIRVVSLAAEWKDQFWNGYDFQEATVNVEMTLRSEWRSGAKYWYAYRRRGGVLQKRFVGKSEQVTALKLATVANAMI